MNSRTEDLIKLMDEHGVSAREVSELLNRAVHTVRVWRMRDDARVIPEHSLEVLRIKLAARQVAA